MTRQQATTLAGILLAVLLCYLITSNFFGLLHFENRLQGIWISRFEFWALAGVLFLFARCIEKQPFLLINEEKKRPLFYLLSPPLTIAFLFALLATISVLRNLPGFQTTHEVSKKIVGILQSDPRLYVFAAITAGVTEELIFRGYLLSRLQSLTGNKYISVIVSAVLFGLAHYNYRDLTNMLFPAIIGIVFGIHYLRYRSLAALVITHVIIDLVRV